ncbi:IucA/IucC family C-terminal-domain containing protein [Fictibacillus terranigra]|uniref:IucA/IucC family C-terminal-domain containing protein n=1 Tax=Fictibacillus terranigra TaxID=3058424 RepID=A0ABT8E7C0_9BACL|nr:IucA/IucC family C-terminal-domain containing protein [Fictibacillus sp. CENA-BCM004]MDN4073811.1 IucA/IucC family C-terminal-domain containing protein [Fictibacillus sp. CENA-BCM004]
MERGEQLAMVPAQLNMRDVIGWSESEKLYFENKCRFQFHFSKEKAAFAAKRLLNRENMLSFIEEAAKKIGSREDRVTASLFFKRYVFCCLTSSLYALSLRNKQFDMRLQNVIIIDEQDKHSWLPSFSLQNLEGISMAGDRERWRSSVIEMIFAQNITILLDHLALYTKASKAMLWENALIYIAWLYDAWRSEEHPAHIKKRLEEDYRFIVQEAEGFHFGTSSNPFLNSSRKYEEKEMPKRQTCCLYYRTDGGTCCKTCPLKEAD